MSSLERLGEAGWLPDVRSEESLPGQACNSSAPAPHLMVSDAQGQAPRQAASTRRPAGSRASDVRKKAVSRA